MKDILLVGIGGFIGAVLRYSVSGWVQQWTGSVRFPYGTLAVNVLGSLVIGILLELVDGHGLFGPEARAVLLVGLVGAFTTFSTFCGETLNLLRGGENVAAVLNLVVQVVLGLAAVWGGRALVQALWR